MKEIFQQLAAYNTWANQLLLATINTLPEQVQEKETPSSFPSLLKTVLHMWDSESMWWQRLKLQEHVVRPSSVFKDNFAEAAVELQAQNKQWQDWITAAQEHQLQHVFHYQNTKREQFKQPVYQMLFHLFNHGSYHRGQLVTMLRQLGIEKIPTTDFIVWSRKK